HFLWFLGGNHRNFRSIVFQSAHQFGFNAPTKFFRSDDSCGRTEAEYPRDQFELSSHMKVHSDPAAIQFAAFLRRMPDAAPDIFRNVRTKNNFHIEWIFADDSERGLQIALD